MMKKYCFLDSSLLALDFKIILTADYREALKGFSEAHHNPCVPRMGQGWLMFLKLGQALFLISYHRCGTVTPFLGKLDVNEPRKLAQVPLSNQEPRLTQVSFLITQHHQRVLFPQWITGTKEREPWRKGRL